MSPWGSTQLFTQLVEGRGPGPRLSLCSVLRAHTPGLTVFPPSYGQNAKTRQLAALPSQARLSWLLHTAWPDVRANTDHAESRLLSPAVVGRAAFRPKLIPT